MKKSIVFSLMLGMLLISANSFAQSRSVKASSNYITRKAALESNFHGLQLTGSPTVIYTQSSGKPSVEIYGPDNVAPLIEVFIEDGVLTVRFKNGTNINGLKKLEVRVSGPALSQAHVRGSGDIIFANGMVTDGELKLIVSGSGDINGSGMRAGLLNLEVKGSGDIDLTGLNARETVATVRGSGDINLKGKSADAKLSVYGSGDISASNLEVENVEARVNGSGDIRCHATATLTGGVNGSGDVRYKGNPQISFSKKGLSKL